MDTFKRGQSTFGFRWEGGRLLVEEFEAATRRRGFDLFLRLRSMGAVARELNSSGHVTRRGGKWSDVQVARILKCPSAIGTYEIGRNGEDAEGRRGKTAKENRVTVEFGPLVTREAWDRTAALIREGRERRSSSAEATAPLTGLVWRSCGERMGRPTAGQRFGCPQCPTSIAAADLEAIFAEDFAGVIAGHPSLAGTLDALLSGGTGCGRPRRLKEISPTP